MDQLPEGASPGERKPRGKRLVALRCEMRPIYGVRLACGGMCFGNATVVIALLGMGRAVAQDKCTLHWPGACEQDVKTPLVAALAFCSGWLAHRAFTLRGAAAAARCLASSAASASTGRSVPAGAGAGAGVGAAAAAPTPAPAPVVPPGELKMVLVRATTKGVAVTRSGIV
jgi:hypothetical protein